MLWTTICLPAASFRSVQTAREKVHITLCSSLCKLFILLLVGAIFDLVRRAVASVLQSEAMARLLEKDAL